MTKEFLMNLCNYALRPG